MFESSKTCYIFAQLLHGISVENKFIQFRQFGERMKLTEIYEIGLFQIQKSSLFKVIKFFLIDVTSIRKIIFAQNVLVNRLECCHNFEECFPSQTSANQNQRSQIFEHIHWFQLERLAPSCHMHYTEILKIVFRLGYFIV